MQRDSRWGPVARGWHWSNAFFLTALHFGEFEVEISRFEVDQTHRSSALAWLDTFATRDVSVMNNARVLDFRLWDKHGGEVAFTHHLRVLVFFLLLSGVGVKPQLDIQRFSGCLELGRSPDRA